MNPDSEILIRPATEDDADAFRELRLESLLAHPEAFGADYETDAARSPDEWRNRLRGNPSTPSTIFLAFDDERLIGATGAFSGFSSKMRHSVTLWGVYVRPEARGQGIAGRLIDACCEWARAQGACIVKLAVVDSNVAAIRAYTDAGFETYGIEPQALCCNGVFYDERLMAKRL